MSALLWVGLFGAAAIVVFVVLFVRAWLRDRAEAKQFIASKVRRLRR